MKMDMASFVARTTEALTSSKGSSAIFHYKFKIKKDNSAEFTWQKFVPEQDIAVTIFFVTAYLVYKVIRQGDDWAVERPYPFFSL